MSKGPFRGDRELPQRLLVLKVTSEADALAWARRFGEAVGATRLELGPLTEAWDLGFGTRPPDAPLRYLLLQQASERFRDFGAHALHADAEVLS